MLKKLLFFLLFFIVFLTACGGNDEEKAKQDNAENKNGEENSEQIEVDKGLLNVEITLPPTFFEGEEDLDTTIAEAEKEGIKVTKNEDGSLTYKMSKKKHKEMMQELKTGMVATIDDMKNDEDYVSIQDITHNDSFSEFTLIVDKEKYENSFDSLAVFGLGFSGMYYQLFSGVDPEDYQVKINVQDAVTKEVFNEVIYPDAFEEMEEEQQDDQGHSGTHTGG
ncbi:hypothetical protein V7138_08440 [Bacillus sp. JJ1533]|uniref:hypothetical protein n=1 Tax=Bacillus sp. JJ1533 TaxID=3122959 RepID=UPI002FFE4ADA